MSDRKQLCPMDPIDRSDHLTFGMLANPLASGLYCKALCNYVVSPSVKYLSDHKTACLMDPSDHLKFTMLANSLPSRLYSLALCNSVISPSGVASVISERDIFIYSCSAQLISFKIESTSKEINCGEHEYMNMSPSLITLATPLISPWVNYLSDRKIASPMDPIDPSDYLTFAMLANAFPSRMYSLALCNYVISPSVKYWSDRKIACPIDPLDRHAQ